MYLTKMRVWTQAGTHFTDNLKVESLSQTIASRTGLEWPVTYMSDLAFYNMSIAHPRGGGSSTNKLHSKPSSFARAVFEGQRRGCEVGFVDMKGVIVMLITTLPSLQL